MIHLKPYQILYSDSTNEYIRNVDADEIIGKFKEIDFKDDLEAVTNTEFYIWENYFGNMPTSQEIHEILNTRKDKNDILGGHILGWT